MLLEKFCMNSLIYELIKCEKAKSKSMPWRPRVLRGAGDLGADILHVQDTMRGKAPDFIQAWDFPENEL